MPFFAPSPTLPPPSPLHPQSFSASRPDFRRPFSSFPASPTEKALVSPLAPCKTLSSPPSADRPSAHSLRSAPQSRRLERLRRCEKTPGNITRWRPAADRARTNSDVDRPDLTPRRISSEPIRMHATPARPPSMRPLRGRPWGRRARAPNAVRTSPATERSIRGRADRAQTPRATGSISSPAPRARVLSCSIRGRTGSSLFLLHICGEPDLHTSALQVAVSRTDDLVMPRGSPNGGSVG